MKKYRYECPHCGGEEINEINTVHVSYRVRAWDEDGEPAEYSEGEPHWDTAERIDGEPYECAHCRNTFARPVRNNPDCHTSFDLPDEDEPDGAPVRWQDRVTYSIEIGEELTPVRGNLYEYEGDDDALRRAENEVLERLEAGDLWAWCTVCVVARLGDLESSDFLGCCSYEDEEAFRASGYYEDMKATALAGLADVVARHRALIGPQEAADV